MRREASCQLNVSRCRFESPCNSSSSSSICVWTEPALQSAIERLDDGHTLCSVSVRCPVSSDATDHALTSLINDPLRCVVVVAFAIAWSRDRTQVTWPLTNAPQLTCPTDWPPDNQALTRYSGYTVCTIESTDSDAARLRAQDCIPDAGRPTSFYSFADYTHFPR